MQHPNTGGLWPNTYKQKSTDPDLQGVINIDGKPVKLVAWYTDGKGGKPKLTIRVNNQDYKKPEPQQAQPAATYDEVPAEFDDDILGGKDDDDAPF